MSSIHAVVEVITPKYGCKGREESSIPSLNVIFFKFFVSSHDMCVPYVFRVRHVHVLLMLPSRLGRFSCSSRWRPLGAHRGTDPHTHNGNESPSGKKQTRFSLRDGSYLRLCVELTDKPSVNLSEGYPFRFN